MAGSGHGGALRQTVRDVLGHLAASEDYHRACLDGTVAAFLAGFAERGGTDLDSVNALGVADYADLSPQRCSPAGVLPAQATAAGSASEETASWTPPRRLPVPLASGPRGRRADDIGVPVTPGEHAERTAWRASYSRFALAEAKPQLKIRHADAYGRHRWIDHRRARRRRADRGRGADWTRHPGSAPNSAPSCR
jgi:hypothetical protein